MPTYRRRFRALHIPRCTINPVQILGVLFGSGPENPTTMSSLMVGMRLHSPGRALQGYADGLVGLGYYVVNVTNGRALSSLSQGTDLALSFGLGLRVLPMKVGSLFADVHYDYYRAEGAPTPIIPVKLGFALP